MKRRLVATAYSYIRFSTAAQIDGDSLRREMTASIEYAAKHALELDESLTLRDLGVSAFRGKNAECGQLRAFMKAVESGRVERGSYLLVESLDRLSRDKVHVALNQFLDIINAGVILVTLLDEHVYSEATVEKNFTELIISITVMSRAHEESLTKSKRRRETWNEQKRQAAASMRPITAKLPFWLERGADGFIVRPEAAATVRRVFELARAGLGYWKIAQTLNAEGVPSPAARSYTRKPKDGSERLWATSSVWALLKNEAVIGNLEMKEAKVEEGQAPVPRRIDGHYPRVIDDDMFYAIRGQRPAPKGRASTLKTNLFTGLLRCGHCGGPMQVDTRTKGGKRSSAVCCTRRRKGMECRSVLWPYKLFEEEFFAFVREVRIADVLEPENDTDFQLRAKVDELRGKAAAKSEAINELLDAVEADKDKKLGSLLTRLSERETELAAIQAELAVVGAQLHAKISYRARAEHELSALRSQFDTMRGLPDVERILLRYAIAEHVAAVVKTINLYPCGSDMQIVDIHTGELRPRDTEPFFRVEFRNGWTRFVTPGRESSTRFNLSKPAPK